MSETSTYLGVFTGHQIDTTVLRKQLFELTCIFESNQSMALKCSPNVITAYRHMMDEFQWNAITGLLISVSITGRMVDDNNTAMSKSRHYEFEDTKNALKATTALFQSPVGVLIPNTAKPKETTLSLREALNKILHANLMNPDESWPDEIFAYRHLNPFLHVYGLKNRNQWKAIIDVEKFIIKLYTAVS